jgi:cyclophilin family peptidyl-prolyl cis-trans isomerase
MRQFSRKLWKVLHGSNRPNKTKKTQPPVRLSFERLEDRTTPAATGTGAITGVAFLDGNHNGVFDTGEVALPAVHVTLSGTANTGAAVNVGENTDVNGSFDFTNVLPGTYQLSAGPIPGLLNGMASFSDVNGAAGVFVSSPLALLGGQTISQNLGFQGGLDSSFISMRQFLTNTTGADFPFGGGVPGSGTTPVNSRANNAPVVSNAIANVSVSVNAAPTQINLAGHFTDPDLANSQITFNTSDGPLNITLFDAKTPQTVANFYDYITSGDYNNAIFTRLVSKFVLQGGGSAVSPSGINLNPVPILPAVPSEFGISNTAGTIAMALSAGNPNSGTNQFFINLVNNNASGTTNLDAQSFTVFGQLGKDAATTATLAALVATPTKNESSSAAASANPGVDFANVPLNNYTGTKFASDATASNFLVINSVSIDSRPESLTYSVVADSNPALVTASISNEHLTLSYATGQVGTATITVQATDTFGATVQQTFTVTVNPSPPVISAAPITADNAANATSLMTTPTATDPQELPITFAYQWLHNGNVISGATSQTLDLTGLTIAKNDTFSVQVTPSDSLLSGALFTSPTVSVTGTNPTTIG